MTGKQKRGFASMEHYEVRIIAEMGGKAVQKKGTGHRWNSETARAARQRVGKTESVLKGEAP